jgi:magnesium chelatase accessory protein
MAEAPPPWWPHAQRSTFAASGGQRWHLQRWPRAGAPVALLLHGTGAGTHSWRHLAPLMAAQFDVIAPDLPGHGFTDTPQAQSLSLPAVAGAVAQLLTTLEVQPALLVGHSAGAAVALRLSLDAQVPASAPIVSINGAILPPHGPLARALLPLGRVLAGNALVAPAFSAWAALPAVTRRLLDSTGSRIDAEGERCYARLVADRAHTAGALRLMASWELAPLAAALPALAAPLWLLAAANDRTLPPSHAQRVRAQLPRAHVIDLPALGHLAHEEDAAAVWRVVEAAWDDAQRAPASDAGRRAAALDARASVRAAGPSSAAPRKRD